MIVDVQKRALEWLCPLTRIPTELLRQPKLFFCSGSGGKAVSPGRGHYHAAKPRSWNKKIAWVGAGCGAASRPAENFRLGKTVPKDGRATQNKARLSVWMLILMWAGRRKSRRIRIPHAGGFWKIGSHLIWHGAALRIVIICPAIWRRPE